MEARFSASVQTGPGVQPAYYTMGTGSFPGLKRPGRGVDHPPPSSAEVKGRVELYLYSNSGPSWPVVGWPLPFIEIIIKHTTHKTQYLFVCLPSRSVLTYMEYTNVSVRNTIYFIYTKIVYSQSDMFRPSMGYPQALNENGSKIFFTKTHCGIPNAHRIS